MRRLVPLLLVPLLLLAPGALVGTAAAAQVVSTDEVATALRSSPVYQQPGLDLVDVPTLVSELNADAPRVVVAVVDESFALNDAAARSQAQAIGRAMLESDLVVLVVTANGRYGAATGKAAAARGVDGRGALAAERETFRDQPLGRDTVTALVTSFAQRVAGQAARDETKPLQPSSGNGWLAPVLLLVLVAGGFLLVRSGRRRKARLLRGLRDEVDGLYARLADDIAHLEPGEDRAAKQALADASERYSTAGALLPEADTPAELAVVRRTAIEGLTAARVARAALGLDPGPEIPPVYASTGPQLESAGQVQVGGEVFEGSPSYEPGRKHYYGGGNVGGRQVPGGWYGVPFWEPFLLGSVLMGGFGHGHHGGDSGDSGGGDGGGDGGFGGDLGGDFGGGDFSGGGDF